MTKHFGALDLYRFIAAFGVAALHYAQTAKFDPNFGFGYLVGNFALFVDFFFILSGFVIGLSYANSVSTTTGVITFLRRRIARIYPLYVLTLALLMVPTAFGFSRNPDKWTTGSILLDVLLIKNWPIPSQLPFNYPAWSISVEWAMYLLFPLIMTLYRRAGMWVLWFLIAAGFAGIEYVIRAGLTDIPNMFGNISPVRALPTFCAGIVISQTYNKISIQHAIYWGLTAFLVAIALMIAHANLYVALAFIFAGTFFTANAYVESSKTFLDNSTTRTLGDASYSVYMWHAIFFTVFIDHIWPRIASGTPPLWYGGLIAIALVFFSILSYRWFELRARNFLSGRSAPTQTISSSHSTVRL